MVFIHGGGFLVGSAREDLAELADDIGAGAGMGAHLYDGAKLASRGVVVVRAESTGSLLQGYSTGIPAQWYAYSTGILVQ